MLDLCCYNGGFALTAALQGAAIINASLNDLSEDKVSFERADITDFMKAAYERGDRCDVIVLDPPPPLSWCHP